MTASLEKYLNPESPHVVISVDRRAGANIIIIGNTKTQISFPELQANYNISLQFKVSPDGITACHMFYGEQNKNRIRFYPELLTSIIPRFFTKNQAITPYQNLQNLYADGFKHGFM